MSDTETAERPADALTVSPYLRLRPRSEAEARADTAELEALGRAPALAFCDYIAARIRGALACFDPERIIAGVGHVKMDLHPTGGWFVSTKKTLLITDHRGKEYRVTVEEVAP